jgi:hypothetical protein
MERSTQQTCTGKAHEAAPSLRRNSFQASRLRHHAPQIGKFATARS